MKEEEGRRKKEEGRRKKEEGFSYLGQGRSGKVRTAHLNIQVLPNSYQAQNILGLF
ncbi:hypothetical protein [Microcoleus sp. herbarium5]|uniref:hypothetical protein n=1 Tax=Microcoleus sp. herbarium5 TaxID=3055434 RepID=UPI002FD35F66